MYLAIRMILIGPLSAVDDVGSGALAERSAVF